jgi:protein-S-isoprenylcysteine O-methyltransferase Ste14
MFKIIIFIFISIFLTRYSYNSLKSSRAHGFFRYFAFECILILVLLNVDYWFNHPFSIRQIISWLLLTSSIFLAVHVFILLRLVGKPHENIEDTTILIKVGAYKYIRHPLYSSLLVGVWGAFLKHNSIFSVIFVLLTTGFLIATAKVEEQENLVKFGDEYADYIKQSKMFIPFLF